MPSEECSTATTRGDREREFVKTYRSRLVDSSLRASRSNSTDLRSNALSIAYAIRQPMMLKALNRLRSAVSVMPREHRLTTLQRLSGRVRALLLAYMESGVVKGRGSSSKHRRRALSQPTSNVTSIGLRNCSQSAPAKRIPTESAGVQRQLGITRVGKDRWRAHVFFLNIRSITACVSSRAQALLYQSVLSQMKKAVLDYCHQSAAASGISNVKDILSSAEQTLANACAEHGLTVDDLGLAYRAEVPAGQMLSRDVWGRYTLQLQKAFAERDALLAGKAAGWPSLRAAWIAILQEPLLLRSGRMPNWTKKRSALCAHGVAAKVDAAWEAGASRRERAMCKKLEKEQRQLWRVASRRQHKSCQDLRHQVWFRRYERQEQRIASASRAVEHAAMREFKRCSRSWKRTMRDSH